jgi:hypothetical protein
MCAGKHNMGVLHRHTQRVQVLDCLICIYEQTLHLESRFHSWNSRSSEFSTQFDCNRKSILSRDTARVRILLRPKPKPDVFNLVQTECVVKMIAPFINYHRLKLERLNFGTVRSGQFTTERLKELFFRIIFKVEWIPPSFDLSKDLRIFQSCHGGLPCDLLIVPFIYHAITEFTSSHNGFGSRGRLGPAHWD